MMGDVDRAEAELTEAVELHADIDSAGGQAHSLQRLAEVRLAQGRRDEARALLDRALLLARWSTMGMHLLQRIFGTLIDSCTGPHLGTGHGRPGRGHPGRAGQLLVLHGDAGGPRSHRLRSRG